MKKIWLIMTTICFIAVLTVTAGAVGAEAYGVYDCLSGLLIKGKSEEKHMSVASTTKLMTALVAAERLFPEKVVEIGKEDTGVEGSSIYLKAGEKLTVKTLLYGLLLESGNDAATALARAVAGSVGSFAGLMNRKAAELKMTGSHFENPSGLEQEGHYSTAKDLCLLMDAVLKEPLLSEIIKTEYVTSEGRRFSNHNKLLEKSDACIGGKTGYTKVAGRCLVSAFEAQGRRVIIVTLRDGQDWEDHLALYEEYRSSLKKTPLKIICTLPLAGGIYRAVTLVSRCEVWLLPGEEVTVRLIAPHFLYRMPAFGDEAGKTELYIGNSRLETKTAVVCGVKY